MSLQQAIKKILYLTDMNQKEFAEILNVERSLINLYLNGKRKPGGLTLTKIHKLIKERNLDMSIEEFLS